MSPATYPWTEIADRCWVARYAEWDVNVGVVAGADGLLVVDTRGTHRQGERLRDEIRQLDPRPVRWVVNTHQHFDHTFGNIAFDDVTIYAHEAAATGLEAAAERVWRLCHEDGPDDPLNAEVIATPLRHPDTTFSSVTVIELGDRYVELLHPGRGHTDGDAVIRVPGADVVFAGDLVEESAPPSFGPDCFPLEWPETLELATQVMGDETVVVPGHGMPVDRAYVMDQRGDVGEVATAITGMVQAGVSVDDAIAQLPQADLPWDPALLHDAVRRGYAHSEPPPRTLPLID